MLYTAWVLQLYQIAISDCELESDFLSDRVPLTGGLLSDWRNILPRLDVIVHVQDMGDRRCDRSGWVGVPGSRKWIEGLFVETSCDILLSEIECMVLMGDGNTVAVGGGEFAGTRGQAIPLTGFRLRLIGAAASRYVGSYEATFVDGSRDGPLAFGTLCATRDMAPIEAIRISLEDLAKLDDPPRP